MFVTLSVTPVNVTPALFHVWLMSSAGNEAVCVAPVMVSQRSGSIINISSIAGLIASDTMPGYNASKAAVWMLSKSVALYCAKMGWDIRCNSVHPTFVDTPILDGMAANTGKPKDVIMDKLARQIPLKRVGQPDDIAHGVLYLASDESRFMTGAELKLDGGISAM